MQRMNRGMHGLSAVLLFASAKSSSADGFCSAGWHGVGGRRASSMFSQRGHGVVGAWTGSVMGGGGNQYPSTRWRIEPVRAKLRARKRNQIPVTVSSS